MSGERIRYYRKRKNLTQEQLAQGICSVSYLSKFENGGSASEEIVRHLCKRLDISYETVDNQREVNETKDLLDDWYQEIKKKNLETAEKQEETIKTKVQSIEEPELSLRYDLFKAKFLLSLGKLEEAKALLDRVQSLQELLAGELEYYYWDFSGVYNYHLGQLNESMQFYNKGEKLLEKLPLAETEKAELYYQQGLVNSRLYMIPTSINYIYTALPIFDQDYNLNRSADCHIILGINMVRIRNYKQAESHFKNALKLSDNIQDIETKKVTYQNLGYLNSTRDKSKDAIYFYKKSLEIDSKVIQSIFLVAREYYKLNDLLTAKEWIKKGMNIEQDEVVKDYVYHLKILQFHVSENLTAEYESLLKYEAIPYFKKVQQWDHVAEYAENLADYYFTNSQYKNAGLRYQQAIQAHKKLK